MKRDKITQQLSSGLHILFNGGTRIYPEICHPLRAWSLDFANPKELPLLGLVRDFNPEPLLRSQFYSKISQNDVSYD